MVNFHKKMRYDNIPCSFSILKRHLQEEQEYKIVITAVL